MEKRTISVLESPHKLTQTESYKKIKISLTPKKVEKIENDANLINTDSPDFDFEGLCFDSDDDFFVASNFKQNSAKPALDLSDYKRCRVQSVDFNAKAFEKVLYLEERKSMLTAKCCIKGIWYETEVQQDDIVSVKAVWDEDRKMFLVSNDSGIIVTSPDFLVSGTTVVGSLFCARKSVLTEKFRGVDCGDSIVMHIGSIVHEIIQTAMKNNLTTLIEIKQVAAKILSNPDIIKLLYSCKITLKDLHAHIDPFLSRIHQFMQQYVVGSNNHNQISSEAKALASGDKLFSGRIAEVRDIEENVWSPHLGLKGKIDVTVEIYPPNNFFNSFRKLMPLEIKTGRSSFSLEHKGQLILYEMMLRDMGREIDSGLLLYIRDGIMSEITSKRREESGLVTLRNRIARYLKIDVVARDKSINLPEPINHHSACSNCPYNTLCCALLKADKSYVLKPNHPLVKVHESHASHLTDAHLDYFLRWCNLITLECNEMLKGIKLKHLWTKTADERATKGTCLANLRLADLVMPKQDEFIHNFRSSLESFNFTSVNFEIGEYIIISTDKRCSITAGRVINLDSVHISLSLPKDLSRQYANVKFHLDKYESQSQTVFNYTNVGVLLENDNERGINQLRSIIIDKTPATFSNSLPKAIRDSVDKIMVKMNSVQRTAVLKALTCENYMLIQGLPGTGKTQTLTNLIHLLKVMKKSILITSHTNSAVDNILLRLRERGIKFLRLGSVVKTHQSLRDACEVKLIENCKSVDDLAALYEKYQIVAVTCLGSAHVLLSQRKFDYCLVDEATQIFQPTVIRPLLSANKFILVGDPQQLAPLVRNNEARSLGANESLFERLDSKASTFVLGLQYRMNKTITKLANNLTYNGELKCADEKIEKAVMQIPNLEKLKERIAVDKWLAKALATHLDQSCSLINTGDVYEMARNFSDSLKYANSQEPRNEKSRLYINYCEIAIVLHIVDLLMECGVRGESIGIVAPYRDQVEALKRVFESYHSVEVNTVDQYQGRDKNIIIYSCTLSETATDVPKSSSEVEILEDRRRLTVAITRAKHKLIMVGDVNCLNKYTPFRDLFKHMNSMSKVQVQNERFGFAWNSLLNKLKVKIV